jgi:multiple sugar transport system ATP-binding protein
VVGESENLGQYSDREVVLGIRPEHIEDARVAEGQIIGDKNDPNTIEVEPQVIESMGSEKYVYFGVPEEQAAHLESIEEITGEGGDGDGDTGGSGSAEDFGDLMVARVSAESQARLGSAVRLAIDSTKIQLFDPDTEKAIV